MKNSRVKRHKKTDGRHTSKKKYGDKVEIENDKNTKYTKYIFSTSIPSTSETICEIALNTNPMKHCYCCSCTTEQQRHNRRNDPYEYLRELAKYTTFHGVRDCYYSPVGIPRVAWIFLISIAILTALQGCYLIVDEFLSRPIIVSYLIEEADRKGLSLPDIVICPFNRFNRSYLDSLNISKGLAQYLELSYPSPALHSFQKRKFRTILKKLDVYDAELTELLQRIGNISFSQFIKQSAIDCTAFFEDKQLCKNLTEIMTSAGKCFRIPGIIQEGDGFGYGAQFVIKLPQKLYHPGVNQMLNDGIAVKLAEKNRGIDHDLSFIPSGVHAIMPLSATRYEFINDPPRYKCENEITSYSRVWCFEMCLTEKAEHKCNCSLAASQAAISSQPRAPTICTTHQFFRCYAPEIFHENITYDIERCKARCKPPCTYWEYGKTISYSHFPSEQTKYFVETEEELQNLKHTIVLEVFYTSLDYTIIRHYYAMTLTGLLAQIGGQISLWIGGSIISLIQVVFYTSGASYALIGRYFHKLKRQPTTKDKENGIEKDDFQNYCQSLEQLPSIEL